MDLDKSLISKFVKCTERAAYGASLIKGKGNKIKADQFAVDEMRNELNKINMKGRIVIGEGEMDDAPMLYIGEKVGIGKNGPNFDIALDPLEGTKITANNERNALTVISLGDKNSFLNAPDVYMEKLAIGPNYPKNFLNLGLNPEEYQLIML